MYERVNWGWVLEGREEREGIPLTMSQYWEWGKAGIISMAIRKYSIYIVMYGISIVNIIESVF